MSHVPCSIIRTTVAVSEAAGIPRARLLGAPSVTEPTLKHPLRRVPWNAFCEFNDRVEAAWNERGGLDAFGRAFCPQSPELSAVARRILGPAELLRALLGVATWAHPYAEVKTRSLAADRFEVSVALPQTLRDNPSFFRINAAVLRHATLLLALPPAEIEAEVRPRAARYVFTLPPSRTVFHTARQAGEAFVHQMLERIDGLQEEVRRLRQAMAQKGPRRQGFAERVGLTTRQREVLKLLSHGLTNRDIAHRLGCTERTVEVHVTEMLRRTGCRNRAHLVASYWAGGTVETP